MASWGMCHPNPHTTDNLTPTSGSTTHPDPIQSRDDLKKTISVTPHHLLSDYYGTRLSTVILVKRTGEALFVERDAWVTKGPDNHLEKGDPQNERRIRFHVQLRP